MKRMTIRLVDNLAKDLTNMSETRGISMNALITEMAWEFVSKWEEKQKVKDNERRKRLIK